MKSPDWLLPFEIPKLFHHFLLSSTLIPYTFHLIFSVHNLVLNTADCLYGTQWPNPQTRPWYCYLNMSWENREWRLLVDYGMYLWKLKTALQVKNGKKTKLTENNIQALTRGCWCCTVAGCLLIMQRLRSPSHEYGSFRLTTTTKIYESFHSQNFQSQRKARLYIRWSNQRM